MTRGERDRISALVWLALAAAICFGSVKLSLGQFNRPGPGFFPFLSGAILGIFSFLSLIQSIKSLPDKVSESFWSNPKRQLKVGCVILALVLYTIGMNHLGFFFSTLLFLAFLFRGIDPLPWPVVFGGSLLGSAACYGLFKCWLDVQLPVGILGF